MVEFHAPGDPDEGVMGYAVVPIMCEKCGHFALFSASLMGLADEDP